MTQTKAQKVAYQKAYAAKNAAKVKAKKRLWYLLHVEERREAERARYHAGPA